jgi:uncharacterized protein
MRFLSAAWKDLIMLNYSIEPEILASLVPGGTELDFYQGKCYVSLVGFMFRNTRVLGIPVPGHVHFEEVNLRFYVRRQVDGEWRRGVVFVKEIVPRSAIAWVARSVYREPYVTMPMRHKIEENSAQKRVEYRWKHQGKWHTLGALAENRLIEMPERSEEEFITEHYYGYNRWNTATTTEYEVRHPRWQVYPILQSWYQVDFQALYGPSFAFLNDMPPTSTLLAWGSDIEVMGNRRFSTAG